MQSLVGLDFGTIYSSLPRPLAQHCTLKSTFEPAAGTLGNAAATASIASTAACFPRPSFVTPPPPRRLTAPPPRRRAAAPSGSGEAEKAEAAMLIQVPVLTNLSACFLNLKQWHKCIVLCDSAIKTDPKAWKAFSRRGKTAATAATPPATAATAATAHSHACVYLCSHSHALTHAAARAHVQAWRISGSAIT